jgi:exosortase A
MNAPVSIDITSPVIKAADWRRRLPPLILGLLLLGLVFNKEVAAAVATWCSSTAYNHCFLIIPIALLLVWDRRFDVTDVPVRAMPSALLLGLPLLAIWLVSERLGIMEGRQLVAVSFVELLFLAVLGRRLWRALAGPLLYLYFLVPFGAFLTPKLQDVTTFFIQHGLEILGVPAYIDGYTIEIPQGTFFVAEACAGLRFLIASIAFGCLYALMMYRSPLRRGIFILVSTIVPVLANGVRGTGIVYLGYLLGSAQAAAADHILYGWLFFSAVILLLIMLGLPFRQDEISTRPRHLPAQAAGPSLSARGVFGLALGMAGLAAIGPAVASSLMIIKTTPVVMPSSIAVGPECLVEPVTSATGSQRVTCDGETMEMRWEAFSPRATAGLVMAERRRMVSRVLTEALSENWLAASAWRIMQSTDPAYVIAVAVWVDGKPVRPGLAMRLRLALNSLTGSAYAPMVVTVTPVVDWATRDAAVIGSAQASLPRFLLTHTALDHTIGALSAQQ